MPKVAALRGACATAAVMTCAVAALVWETGLRVQTLREDVLNLTMGQVQCGNASVPAAAARGAHGAAAAAAGRGRAPVVVWFAVSQKGGTSSFNSWLGNGCKTLRSCQHRRGVARFPYADSGTPRGRIHFFINLVAAGAASRHPNTRTVWIMRDPTDRAWSEWLYRSAKNVEPTALSKARASDTWQTYILRQSDHTARHTGSGAIRCMCDPAERGSCVMPGRRQHPSGRAAEKRLFRCLFSQPAEQVASNADEVIAQLPTFAVVGVLERMAETMVLLWHAGLLNFVTEPCEIKRSNSGKKHAAKPEGLRAFVEAHCAQDVRLYHATVAEFKRRIWAAERCPETRVWLQRARAGRLPMCPPPPPPQTSGLGGRKPSV